MLRAIKIRLYPNKSQENQINKLLGCYRFVYNQCLEKKINSYKENKTSENLSTLSYFLHHELLKDDNFSPNVILQSSLFGTYSITYNHSKTINKSLHFATFRYKFN